MAVTAGNDPDPEPRARPSSVVALAGAVRGLEEARRRAAAPVDLPGLCAEVLAIVVEAVGASRASLLVTNPRTGRLRIVAAFGLPSDIVGRDLQHQGRRISDWVVREGRALLLNGEVHDQRFEGSAPREVESALCLPLPGSRGAIGVLNLARATSAEPFGPPDLATGEHLARSLAAVVEVVAVREASERNGDRLGAGAPLPMSIGPGFFQGRSYQLALTHVPSMLRGGDVAERVVHHDGSQTIMVADVPGHGVDAVVVGGLVQGLFLALARTYRSPAEVARRFNAALHRRLEGRTFVAAWFATLSTGGRLLSCTAGFPPPICVPMDGDDLRRLAAGGPVAGVLAEPDYEEQAARLLPGDIVLAVSDGVLRARDAAGHEFGAAGVEELAVEQRRQPLDRVTEVVCGGALEHGSSAVPVDDLMALALRSSREV
jgi:hypothetical protein